MAREESPAVLRDIHALFHVGTSNGLTDAQLLDRFRARSDQDSSEAAFAGLMARHGPMVLGVCRRALRNPDDVADAFQATFLILVRKANSVRVEDSLGRWLYGVSRRVSVRAKLAAARRSAREVREIELATAPADDADLRAELRDILDEEIASPPPRKNSALRWCYANSKASVTTRRSGNWHVPWARSRAGWESRAAEASLPIDPPRRPLTACALYVESTPAAVPAKLIEMTIKAAVRNADGVIAPAVDLLIRGVLRAAY